MHPWLLLNAAAVLLLVGLTAWVVVRPPAPPLRLPILGMLACAFLWVMGDVITFESTGLAGESIGIALVYSGTIPLSVANWLLALGYAEAEGRPFRFRGRAAVRGPLLYVGVAWSLMITNPLHGWFLTPVIGGRNEYHALWWATVCIGYAFTVAALVAFAILVRRGRTRDERVNAAVVLTAMSLPLAGNLIYVLSPEPPPVDLSMVGVVATSAITLIAIYRRDLFFLQPIALAALLRSDPAGIVLIDRHGLIRYSTPAARALLGENECVPHADALALIEARIASEPGADGQQASHWLRGRLSSHSPRPSRAVFRLVGEPERWMQLGATPVISRRGSPLAVYLRIEDVTAALMAREERRRFETRALQAQKLEGLGLLAGGIAHDFNNLLTGILGNVSLALQELESDGTTRRLLLDVGAAAEQAAGLVNQMLDFAGASSPIKKPIDLSAEVAGMVDLLVHSISKKAVVERTLESGLPPVDADLSRIQQVLMNLVINASDALGDEPGSIRVVTGRCHMTRAKLDEITLGQGRPAGDYAYFEVSDDGSGMDAEARTRLFDPFFTTKFTGRGLGMAGSLGIVNAHRGAIEVETQAGVGTRIRVLLPFAPGADDVRGRAAPGPRR